MKKIHNYKYLSSFMSNFMGFLPQVYRYYGGWKKHKTLKRLTEGGFSRASNGEVDLFKHTLPYHDYIDYQFSKS